MEQWLTTISLKNNNKNFKKTFITCIIRNTQENNLPELSLLENLTHPSDVKELMLQVPLASGYE